MKKTTGMSEEQADVVMPTKYKSFLLHCVFVLCSWKVGVDRHTYTAMWVCFGAEI